MRDFDLNDKKDLLFLAGRGAAQTTSLIDNHIDFGKDKDFAKIVDIAKGNLKAALDFLDAIK